jgi:indole-3-glycerol phosphate synthase
VEYYTLTLNCKLTPTVPDILGRIVARKQEELAAARPASAHLKAQATLHTRRDFAAALRSGKPAIIAEIKKASPSKGVLAQDFDPPRTARQYESGGASALSVLTDRDYFQGSLQDLESARSAVALPVIRKDFTIAEYHVLEAAAHGADAILLIAAILDEAQLRGFRQLAAEFGMASLVEVHNDAELDLALKSGAEILGVNNRDLHTFEVHLETSHRLAARIPASVIKVSESGIRDSNDVRSLMSAGYDAFLVGEHLMKSPDPAAALRSMKCS